MFCRLIFFLQYFLIAVQLYFALVLFVFAKQNVYLLSTKDTRLIPPKLCTILLKNSLRGYSVKTLVQE